jgi:hypothetical protein
MPTSRVEVETHARPLSAVRSVLEGADEALLGVAFVQQRGVNLLQHQLRAVPAGRLVTTTVFGSTTSQGLQAARDNGLGVRVLSPSGGTFHRKLYADRHGDRIMAIGSPNLTSGLIANVEVVAVVHGSRDAPQLRRLWELAESWWRDDGAVDWSPERVAVQPEVLLPDLLARIEAALGTDREVLTLSDRRPNWVRDVTPDGVWVETQRSRRAGRPPQLVEAWMIQIAWDWLSAHGSLTNRWLLSDDGLNVKRSSFVCALLARLPDVRVASTRPITLVLRGPVSLDRARQARSE